LASILTNLNFRDVLFIDEIHRMHVSIEEILYSGMEDYRLDIIFGQGLGARTMKIDISPFTLIGATTKSGILSSPLRDRFTAHLQFDFYEPFELSKIVYANSVKMNLVMDDFVLNLISNCSRGTPRIANRILRRVRDYAVVKRRKTVSKEDLLSCLSIMEIDLNGLDKMDRKILKVIKEFYKGGPVGIDALCATLGEERSTIEEVYEPYLLKQGYLLRTSRGREISEKAVQVLEEWRSC
jgi:Holliday junction DNA helicase RuvB